MIKKIKWGIIGAGRIARKFAIGIQSIEYAELHAIASRDMKKAFIFASEHKITKHYGSYEEIVNDSDIDIIYIATPHVFHHQNTLMCLNAGKAVLCEKPFAMKLSEAQEMVDAAKKNNVFLMEAFWTRFTPSFKKVEELISIGVIGNIKFITADFTFKAEYDPQGRLYNKSLGGGAMMDVGIYPLFLAYALMGKPHELKALASICSTGVDETCSFSLKYNNGSQASLSCSVICQSANEAIIIGDKGRIKMLSNWYRPTNIELVDEFGEISHIKIPSEGNGYNYEAAEATQCLINGKTESSLWPLSKSLELMELLERVCEEAGISY